MNILFRVGAAGLWLAAAAGCAGPDVRLTGEQLEQARAAVQSAEDADAANLAPNHLQQAQDALAIAKDALARNQQERAFEFAKKASIYARVASARSAQKKAEDRLRDAQRQLMDIRRETEQIMADKTSSSRAVTPTAKAGPTPKTEPVAVATPPAAATPESTPQNQEPEAP